VQTARLFGPNAGVDSPLTDDSPRRSRHLPRVSAQTPVSDTSAETVAQPTRTGKSFTGGAHKDRHMRPIDDTPLTRDGKMLILAYDHGLEHGPVDFEDVPESADPARVFDVATHPAVTSLAVQKGIAEAYYPSYEDDVSLMAKLNGTSNLWMGEYDSAVNCSVDYAVDIGAEAIGFTLYNGSNHEVEMAEEFREAQEQAREHDLPVVMWAYPRGQGVKNDTKPGVIAYGARQALELGADVVKVKNPGSKAAMEHTVEMAGRTKVIMSGGSKRSDREFLQSVKTAMDAGTVGLAVGRNVFQREQPERILDALEQLIFEEASVEDALAATER
jgi:class I fructose-bisphosphate aldolase